MESTDLRAFEAHLTRKDFGTSRQDTVERMSHPIDTPLGSDVSTLEPLICIASCLVIGKLAQPVRPPHGRLMQVTRPLKPSGASTWLQEYFDAAHMAVAMAVAVYLDAVLWCPERSSSCCCHPKRLMMAFIIFP